MVSCIPPFYNFVSFCLSIYTITTVLLQHFCYFYYDKIQAKMMEILLVKHKNKVFMFTFNMYNMYNSYQTLTS